MFREQHRAQVELCPQSGFSLIELVIVILLLSILAASALLQWPGQVLNLDAQAHQLAGDIRYAQSLAMTRGARYRIDFFADRYRLSDLTGTPIAHPIVGVADVWLDTGITLASGNAFLVFDGRGAPYTTSVLPGTPLAADAVVTLTASGDTKQVRISPQTGRVVVQ